MALCKSVGVVLLFGAVAMLLIIMLSGRETHISDDRDYLSTTSLYCYSNSPKNVFFVSSTEVNEKHELKFLFDDGQIKNISYFYNGEFNSDVAAGKEISLMHAQYNKYMAKTNINQEVLTPVFVVIEKSATINLFFDGEDFTVEMAPLIFLDRESFEKIDESSVDMVEDLYESLGFSCNINK